MVGGKLPWIKGIHLQLIQKKKIRLGLGFLAVRTKWATGIDQTKTRHSTAALSQVKQLSETFGDLHLPIFAHYP